MPKLKPGSVPRYRLHKATGLGVVTLNGRDIYLGRHGSPESLQAYHTLVAKWIAGGREPLDSKEGCLPSKHREEPPAPGSITVVELISRFYAHLVATYPSSGRGSVPASFKTPLAVLRQAYGRELAAEFSPKKLKSVRDEFVARNWVRAKVNANVNKVRRCFRWGCEEELIPPSVFQSLAAVENLKAGRSTAKESKKTEPIPAEDIEAAIAHLSPELGDMVRILWLTGARPSEVFTMRPGDIDRTSDVWVYRPMSHKTLHHGKNRQIAIGPRCQAVLSKYLDRQPDQFCFSPREIEEARRARAHAQRQTPIGHGNSRGRRSGAKQSPRRFRATYSKESFRKAIERACEKAGIKPWTTYRLRHSRGTEIRAKYGLDGTQACLGHSSATVSELYASVDLTKAVNIAREIG